jgi:putative acetyltransferase
MSSAVPQLPSPPVAAGVVIRPERDADHPVIAEVVRAAFVGHPDEVASFVERIRASEEFIPELALVAEDSSGVIAHVMLSWVGVEGGSRPRILNLTPMSVRPDRQRMGVGTRLIRDALGRAEEAGEAAVMVEGIAAYYPRFGFEKASALGFISPHPKIPDDAFMVKRLPGYSPDLAGRIRYPAAFDGLGYYRRDYPRTRNRRMAASPDRTLLTGSRSTLVSPGDENGMRSPSSTGSTYTRSSWTSPAPGTGPPHRPRGSPGSCRPPRSVPWQPPPRCPR